MRVSMLSAAAGAMAKMLAKIIAATAKVFLFI
jgi:hypothetical protein